MRVGMKYRKQPGRTKILSGFIMMTKKLTRLNFPRKLEALFRGKYG